MRHTLAFGRSGCLKLGLLMAAIGFTYGLISSRSPNAEASLGDADASTRVLGTDATRRPATFVTGPDLGAVVANSQFVRQILVQFGFRPHSFTFGNFPPLSEGVSITKDGRISGADGDDNVGQEIFDVVVSDSPAGRPLPPTTAFFTYKVVQQEFGTPLHFETGGPITVTGGQQDIVLPVAITGESYACTIQPNGGRPPYQYRLVAATGARFLPRGIAFDFEQGLFFGRPTVVTPAGKPNIINVLLTDTAGGQVVGRFMLDVLPGTISSQAVATAGKMTLRYGAEKGRDSLDLTLQLEKASLNNAGVRDPRDLNGLPIEINFGGQLLPPKARANSKTVIKNVFNEAGRIDVPPHKLKGGDTVGNGGVVDVIYSIVLDPKKGTLKIHFENLQMIQAIGADFIDFEGQDEATNRGPVIPINIKIGLSAATDVSKAKTKIDRTDLVKFIYKRSQFVGVGTARQNDNVAPGGIFLINKVVGTEQQTVIDKFNSIKADRIFLQMSGLMRQPGAKPVVPSNSDRVDVFLSQVCLGTFPANSLAVKGDKLTFFNDDPSKGLRSLIIDNKSGKVLITTNGLDPEGPLFNQGILVAGVPVEVPVTITIGGNRPTPTFDGQSTVTLFRYKTAIKNK